MFLRLLLGFLWAARALAAGGNNATQEGRPPPLLLVSLDGFRADYLQRFPMPNLKLLYSQGVLVDQLTNVFVTKTFPNHYSLVTGLYAESHGIVASNMYDPVSQKHFHVSSDSDPAWWNQAEPLWVSALDSGYKTAAVMWPGSDVKIRNRTATHFFPYSAGMSFRQRLGNVTNWMLGSEKEEGVMFAALYWEEPDRTGHIFGPDNSTAMGKALKEVDDNIGLLMSELKRVGLWGRVNVLVTSDHGMAQCSDQKLIRLDDCLQADDYELVDLTPVAALIPKKDPDAVFAKLSKCHVHMTAYLKKTIPDRLHYRHNQRIQPIILLADEGWTIVQSGDKLPRLGDHGYDNSLPSMHPFFAAAGPSFSQGFRLGSMESVDVYPLMCRLLALPAQPNNGTLSRARCMLAADNCWVVSFVVGVVLLLTAVSGILLLLRNWRCRRRSGPQPFQRLRIDTDDDVALLE